MSPRHLRNRRLQRWILALALPWLLLRLLLPAGVMPIVGAGGLALDLCTPQGLAIVAPERGDGPAPASAHDAPCAFAATANAAPPPVTTAVTVIATAAAAASTPRPASLIAPTVLRAQSPRGPPLHV